MQHSLLAIPYAGVIPSEVKLADVEGVLLGFCDLVSRLMSEYRINEFNLELVGRWDKDTATFSKDIVFGYGSTIGGRYWERIRSRNREGKTAPALERFDREDAIERIKSFMTTFPHESIAAIASVPALGLVNCGLFREEDKARHPFRMSADEVLKELTKYFFS